MRGDKELVQEIKQGNTNAMGCLYERYYDKVYFKCLSIIKDNDAAYDIANEAILKSFEKIDSFRMESEYSTWLYRIVTNYALTYVKRHKRLAFVDLLYSLDLEEEGQIIDELEYQNKLSALDSLSNEERTLLYQKYIESMSIRELQNLYNSGASAIKMKLLRVRERALNNYNLTYSQAG